MRLASMVIITFFVLVTNRWLSHEDGIRILEANDTRSSMIIARAAPALPSQPVPFHHAQRIAVSYAIGLAAKAIPLSYHVWFAIVTLLCFAAILRTYVKILDRLRITEVTHFILLSLLILNPYSFRYYFAAPGMVYDLVFVLGLTLAVLGLLEVRFSKVLIGLLVASLGRQTGLLLLPALGLWIFRGSSWRERPPRVRALAIAALVACSLTIYLGTAKVASQFATRSTNVETLTRIFIEDQDSLTTRRLAEIVLRALIPMAFPICILLGGYLSARPKPRLTLEFWGCLLFSFFITLQPFLGGGTNLPRLSALGLIPWFTALAMVLQESQVLESPRPVLLALLQSLIVFGSFHHMYTYIGGDRAQVVHFLLIYLSLAILSGHLTYVMPRLRLGVSGPGSSNPTVTVAKNVT